jgi:hypothetical protein
LFSAEVDICVSALGKQISVDRSKTARSIKAVIFLREVFFRDAQNVGGASGKSG